MYRLIKKFKKSELGAAAIEMALVFPLFILFVLGIIEFSRAYWILHTMQLAIEEAARYATINTTAYDSAVISKAQENLYGFNSSQFTITSASQNVSGVTYKVITASYQFNSVVPNLLPFNGITLTRSISAPLM